MSRNPDTGHTGGCNCTACELGWAKAQGQWESERLGKALALFHRMTVADSPEREEFLVLMGDGDAIRRKLRSEEEDSKRRAEDGLLRRADEIRARRAAG